ncbi:MAG TPA: hypothetical protein VF820_05340 [Patescibacteria group bacterium]
MANKLRPDALNGVVLIYRDDTPGFRLDDKCINSAEGCLIDYTGEIPNAANVYRVQINYTTSPTPVYDKVLSVL